MDVIEHALQMEIYPVAKEYLELLTPQSNTCI